MRKLKVAFYGVEHEHCGAKVYEIKQIPDVFELVGVVCENEYTYQKRVVNDKAYEGVKILTEEELFARDDIDLVFVEAIVPEAMTMAKKCIDKGWHIHLDKPAGVDLDEYKEILDCAKAKGLVVQMGYMYRHNNAITHSLNKVRDGFVGDVFSIVTSMCTSLPKHMKERLIAYNVKSPAMFIYGCHLIDLVLTFWGEPLRVVPFNKNTKTDGLDFEDNSLAVLEFPNGVATIKINSSEICGWERREFSVSGTKGSITIRPIEAPTIVTECSIEDAKPWAVCSSEIALEKQNGRYIDQMIQLAKIINKEMENPYSYEHDYLVHKLTLIACGYDY